jgi:3-hydroxyacyl-CoA dehydrogenase
LLDSLLQEISDIIKMAFMNQITRRGLATSVLRAAKIQEFVVIGGGLMGAGIAQVGAQTGHKVTLVDLNSEVLDASAKRIAASVARVAKKQFKDDADAAEKFRASVMSNIHTDTTANKALETADLVVEAVVENMGLKQKLFKEYDAIAPPKTIFASNTSSLPIAEIASSTSRLDRFGGLHFFNPVPIMKLLEVIRIPETSDETFNAMVAWGKAMKKVTVDCKDTPGFIVNRLLVPYLMEAVRMVERGDASAKDVDTAMKLGAGHPMGPFELADYVGLDTNKFIMDGWSERYPDETLFRASEMLNKLVAENKLGKKTGEGFYKY